MARQRLLLSLRWGDMDAYRHVNNVEIMRLLEEARVRAFGIASPDGSAGTAGRTAGGMLATGMVVAKHTVEYLAPLDYRLEPVAVDLWIGRVGGASFEVDYEIREPEDASRVYARASTVCVSYDFDAGRPRRLNVDERARLAALGIDPVPDPVPDPSPTRTD